MHEARTLRKKRGNILHELNLNKIPKKNFTYLGNLHPVKGTDLIIRSFVNANLEDAVLLIVGTGNSKYLDYCRSLAKPKEGQIYFLGSFEFKDIQKIYAVSDFILRGDPDFRIGRTTFEALYAGSAVILPGNQDDLAREKDLQNFTTRILLYEPGDVQSLAKTITYADKSETGTLPDNAPTGNMVRHCREMQEFIAACMNG